MKIYIDFDDVICETAKYFTKIAKELFNIDVPYREVQFFNLQKSFDLSGEQYDELMKAGHIPENLLDYEETPGASEVINKWVDEGHEVFVVTGRPFDSYEPSRRWLDEHHLNRLPIYFVDYDTPKALFQPLGKLCKFSVNPAGNSSPSKAYNQD